MSARMTTLRDTSISFRNPPPRRRDTYLCVLHVLVAPEWDGGVTLAVASHLRLVENAGAAVERAPVLAYIIVWGGMTTLDPGDRGPKEASLFADSRVY